MSTDTLLSRITGNISNRELEQLIVPLIPSLVAEFQSHSFIELGQSGLVVRG
jgi:predicted nuclease of predicted toxin-antitoxin system